MTTLAIHRETPPNAIALPESRVPIAIRVAVASDLKFIDDLQKKHSKMVGFMFTPTLQAKIKAGNVVIAEANVEKSTSQQVKIEQGTPDVDVLTFGHFDVSAQPVGYCIFQDKYDKHENCGIFYQVNVVPGRQRGLVGAAMVKAQLARAAYGCRLACCWCAQDLDANYFWESLGFVPLAFRTGSRRGGAGSKKEPRIHIFWQRRIREGDESTPYWFPSETRGGALGEARLVLPIPPGTHWSDAKPAVLPGMEGLMVLPAGAIDPSGGGGVKKVRVPKAKMKVIKPPSRPSGGLWFAPPKGSPEVKEATKAEKPKRERFKNDPKMVGAARELRDRYIDEINAPHSRLLPASTGKYDVSRQLEATATLNQLPPPQLLQAA